MGSERFGFLAAIMVPIAAPVSLRPRFLPSSFVERVPLCRDIHQSAPHNLPVASASFVTVAGLNGANVGCLSVLIVFHSPCCLLDSTFFDRGLSFGAVSG